ncbi:hypothetical protein ACJX0J_038119, partial [Zea mays]
VFLLRGVFSDILFCFILQLLYEVLIHIIFHVVYKNDLVFSLYLHQTNPEGIILWFNLLCMKKYMFYNPGGKNMWGFAATFVCISATSNLFAVSGNPVPSNIELRQLIRNFIGRSIPDFKHIVLFLIQERRGIKLAADSGTVIDVDIHISLDIFL